MASPRVKLTLLFKQAFQDLGLDPKFGEVSVSDRPDLAQYQCNGALGAAKALKKNPREVAQSIQKAVEESAGKLGLGPKPFTLSLAGPGFINLVFDDAALAQLSQAQADDPRLGSDRVEKPKTYVIDYAGPNVAKLMHVGHIRSTIIGDSMKRILEFTGEKVIGDNHLGDWGTPMGMVIGELEREQPQLPYFDAKNSGPFPKESPVTVDDLERIYPEASKRAKTDPEFEKRILAITRALQGGTHAGYRALWQHFVDVTLADMNRNFASLGIHIDHHLGESFYEEKMPALVEHFKSLGITEMSEGALIIPVADEVETERPPIILVKSGGGFLYHTSDLATIQYRVDHFKADTVLYVVDKRQSLHFRQVFTAAKKAGLCPHTQLVHTAFGTMNGPDGKPFKTRDGGVIKLKDFIDMILGAARKRLAEMGVDRNFPADELETIARQVGIATIKFADLKNNRIADYVFDPERFSAFEGATGPYLQYAGVRIQSILRKAEAQSLKPGKLLPAKLATERALMLELHQFADVVARAAESYEPHPIADYGLSLAQAFNGFYKDCHILTEPDEARRDSWLALCTMTLRALTLSLRLLGIEIPARM